MSFFSRVASFGLASALLILGVGAEILYAGVNSAGGEFAQQNIPGAFGIDYQFVNQSAVDFFLDAGVNTIRVTFLLERMCPLETGLGTTFNETYFEEFQKAVNYITMRGGYAVLDAHNYMRYNDPSMQPNSGSIIGNSSDPKSATTANLASFWGELSTRFVSNPNVIFGISTSSPNPANELPLNEPHDMPTELVLTNDQASIDAIRQSGAQQLILVPGNGFSGGQRWLNSSCSDCKPNAEVFTAIQDPLNNFAFDMHLYFDNDTSGTHPECTNAAPANLLPVTTWLREHNYTAFLSEFGAGSNMQCFQTLNNTLTSLEQNPQWIGWTYWSAGPLWGDYFLSIEPGVGVQSNTTWPMVLEPHIQTYQPMQRCGISEARKEGSDDRFSRLLDGCLGLRLPGM